MESQSQQISKLIELNDELENYFRNTLIPQLFVDANLILRKFTPPAMKQFKLAMTDIGKPIAAVTDNIRFPAIVDNIQKVIDTKETLEKEIQTTDLRWYQMNIIPYFLEKQNKTNGVIITFVDVTTRIKDLKEQEKLVIDYEMLLDTITHDIKNPLTGLSIAIQMLKKLPERGMEHFPKIVVQVEKNLHGMQQFIEDLTKSRLEQHRYQAVEEHINFEHIVEDVKLTLAPQIEESNADITSEISVSEIVFVRRNLRSLVYNLVSNAIKYRSPKRKPEILIKTEAENGFRVISVADNGAGIAKRNFKTIFDKYRRLSEATEGSGVGLYLVKEILNSSGGKITVDSELGKGSIFKVYLNPNR